MNKKELEIEIETLTKELETKEHRLWLLNTKEWCTTFLAENNK